MAGIGTPSATPSATSGERSTSTGKSIDSVKDFSADQESQINEIVNDNPRGKIKATLVDEVDDVDEDVEDEDYSIEDEDGPEEDDEDEEEDDEEEDLDEEDEEEDDEEEDDTPRSRRKPSDATGMIADMRRQMRDMRKEIARLSKPRGQEAKEELTEEEVQDETVAPARLGLTKQQIAEAIDDPDKMLEMFELVYQKAREDTIRSVPTLVNKSFSRAQAITTAVQEFYQEHPQLKKHMDYVTHKTAQVQAQHPDWPITKVLKASAARSYQGLGIKQKARAIETARQEKKDKSNRRIVETEERKKPAFAGKQRNGGGQRGGKKDARTPLQRQIDELL